ncbi:T9SS type A sorting domain-containing protein [Persicobacter diffluens]|uniref:Secretion system C-terminal sorting domain-containing protein n=1 Tax=Persicobacter diffluens TaxID=981 RepID=A0AAN5AMB9_9BACT|nr:hypothetical protein PEDI_22750 [Persicobacter diffluens]
MKKTLFLLLSFIGAHAVNAQRSLPDKNVRIAEALQQQMTFRKEQAKAMFGHDSIAVQREFWRLDSLYQEELRHWEVINNPYFTQAKVKSSMKLDSTLVRVFDDPTKKWIDFERTLYRYNDQDLLTQQQKDTLISTTESEARTLTSFEYDQEGRMLSLLVKEYNLETGVFDERSKKEYKFPNEYTTITHLYGLNPKNGQLYKASQSTISDKPAEHWQYTEWLDLNTEGDTILGRRETRISSPLTKFSENYQWNGKDWAPMNKYHNRYDEDQNLISHVFWQNEGTQFTSSERNSYEYEEGKLTAQYYSKREHDEEAWKDIYLTHLSYNQGDTLMVEDNFNKQGEVWVQYTKSFELPSEKGVDFWRYEIRNGEMYLLGGKETTLDEMKRKTMVMDFYIQGEEKVPTYRHIYQYNGSEKRESKDVLQFWSEDTEQWLNIEKIIQSYNDQGKNILFERSSWSTLLNDWEGTFKSVREYNEAGAETLYENYTYLKESQSWLLSYKIMNEIREGFESLESYQYDYDIQKLVGTHKSLMESTNNGASGNFEIYRFATWEWDVTEENWVLEYDIRQERYEGTKYLKWVDYYNRQYPEWARNHRIKYYYRDFEEENDDVVLATDEAFGFQLMPNPATDYFRISGPAEVQELKIMKASGQQVRTYPGGESQYFIGDLSAGVYHIVLTSGSKQAVFKLLKQ